MDIYLLVKTLHILSAAILFGTGIGIATLMFFGHRGGIPSEKVFAARMTVKADFFFTLPAVIIQPLSGAWLVYQGGFAWNERWLLVTYALYILAGLCWIPVVIIQIRMKAMLESRARGGAFSDAAYKRLFAYWFTLGWPAFGALVIVFWLMAAKPSW